MTRCLYLYENLVRERMFLLGVRSVSPDTHMVGYQHASVTLSHTNFLLGLEEAKITPLPKTILTTGNLVKEWLEEEGNYPPGMFKVACGLRQGALPQFGAKRRSRQLRRVLVVLGVLHEYAGVLMFLDKAGADKHGYEIKIHPHPLYPTPPWIHR